jgi:hypothetical protein
MAAPVPEIMDTSGILNISKDCYMKLQETFRLVFLWFRIGINGRLL